MDINDGSILLNFISKLDELEWKRYQQRYPYTLIDNQLKKVDHSSYPPFTSFRFKNENLKVINMLNQAINSYQGDVEWVLTSTKRKCGDGVNHCILTKYVHGMKESMKKTNKINIPIDSYISEIMPQFGPVAYNDLINLAKHIECFFINYN